MAASRRNRYSRALTGENAIGFFSPVTAYTTATTYQAFVTLSALSTTTNGTMAIINATTGAVVTTLLAEGTRFFIAQIVDGNIKKSPTMTFNVLIASGPDTKIKKTSYAAPVLQSITLGYDNTSGDLGMTAGTVTAPINYTVSARDTSPATQPFPVQSGTIKSTVSTASKLELASALASDFVNALDYEKDSDIMFCTCDLLTNGTVTNLATRTATFINGATNVTFDAAHGLVASTAAYIKVVSTGVFYKIIAIPTTSTMTLDRPYQGTSFTTAGGGTSFITVANLGTATLVGLNFTTIVEDTTFVLSYATLPLTQVPTVVTAWKQGSGAAWQARSMEEDTAVMSGYINANAPFVDDLGKPSFFVTTPETSTVQYEMYFITYRNTTPSMAEINQAIGVYGYIIMGIPNSGGPLTTINTVFGS